LAPEKSTAYENPCIPSSPNTSHLSLPALQSRTLLIFALEFEPQSAAPLALCANGLRVLGEKPIREKDIPLLTGGSAEVTGIGWQLKPYIVVEPDLNAKRGKIVRLNARGLQAHGDYQHLLHKIEKSWELRFGREKIHALRSSLLSLFDQGNGHHPRISEGLVSPPGVVRSGEMAPALGRRHVGAAARQRMRDLVAQTESFISDPAGTLPHYPIWDMNRGFEP
jgi:hypothetical protein